MEHWIIGVTVGTALALLGSLIGTYLEMRNVKGPRERGFVLKTSVLLWVGVGTYIAVVGFLPTPWPMLLLAVFIPWLIGGARKRQQIQARIHREETEAGAPGNVQI
jgi:hypothetical protein